MKQNPKPSTVRLTIDFPLDQHTYIKMLAAKEGVSLRQFVIEHLPSLDEGKKKHKDVEKDEFDELLKELLVEKADVLKRLSKK
ncbi:unknown protein [Parachlamydia acanthamoebae UV-7]|uniref:Uncharacterized protein n=2 Tax=Parachlamydia acanthamoebae TaxID=83552 RepID=F8KWW2_PARAV|nr:hypothetical protein [Parachlamydia acanthamoebae]KIA77724.1 hypothetical protein DB43_FV00050 [Parachlamydia acanthamoebae]CCB86558.1 unknown protein [Parachlamydia acanthamoebae UV-7]